MSLLALALLAACSSEPDVAATPAPAPTAPVATAPPEAAGGAAHGHGAAHGGIQNELDGMHVEGLVTATSISVWLTDGDARPLDVTGTSASATVKGPAGISEVPLALMGDHFMGAAALTDGQPATVVVAVTSNGKAQSTTFEIAAVGAAAARPAHGTPGHDHARDHLKVPVPAPTAPAQADGAPAHGEHQEDGHAH